MKNFRRYFAWTLLSTMFLGGCLNTQIPTDTPAQVNLEGVNQLSEEKTDAETDEILNYMVEVDETNLEIDRLMNEYEEIQQ
ncbi:MAG TPA: hypothetical protein PLB38_03350 [bacterium]|nr:hypothetical protein [bacterium]